MKVTYLPIPPSRVGERIQRIDLQDGEVMRMGRSNKKYCRVGDILYVKWEHSLRWDRSVLQPWSNNGRSTKHIPYIGEIVNYEGNLPT